MGCPAERILQIRDVVGDRGGPALTDVDLDVHAGECVGVAGVAGNGQRELYEAVLGLRATRRGEIYSGGSLIRSNDPASARRAGIVGMSEDPVADDVIAGLRVLQNSTRSTPSESPPFIATWPHCRAATFNAFYALALAAGSSLLVLFRRDSAYGANLYTQAVDLLVQITDAAGIYKRSPMQRYFRDTHALVQHTALVWDLSGQNYGQVAFGSEPILPIV